jgi:hypothetical protein
MLKENLEVYQIMPNLGDKGENTKKTMEFPFGPMF